MPLPIASRADVPPFHVMEVIRRAGELERAGHEVLHLEVGQPSTPAPAGALEAAAEAMRREPLGYTDALGIPDLRTGIAAHYATTYGLDVDPRRIVATTGASGGFTLAFLACFEPGDRVVVASPGYPCYRNVLAALDIEVVDVPVGPETRFQPTPELLEANGPLHGVVIASPSNPAGTMLDADELARLVGWCDSAGVRLVSDEIYHGLTYGTTVATAAACSDDAVVVNSFSKYWSMTGWRIGWLVAPADLVRPIERLAQNLVINAPTISQHAAVAALGCRDECEENVARYVRNRAVLLHRLPRMGLDRLAPADGAFYVYADVTDLGRPATDLCSTWLEELGVATTPGIDFDPTRGERFVRFSFAGATADIEAACDRLEGWLVGR
ncbi:MAG: pyridoxal phosphate-dependent aminotransferase [Actinomycetota bacterium]